MVIAAASIPKPRRQRIDIEKFGYRKQTGRAVAPAAGGSAYSPSSFGIGADPGHHEHRSPSTSVPTEASG
jgi:hypothetical protein